jgi:hypothetical protein
LEYEANLKVWLWLISADPIALWTLALLLSVCANRTI